MWKVLTEADFTPYAVKEKRKKKKAHIINFLSFSLTGISDLTNKPAVASFTPDVTTDHSPLTLGVSELSVTETLRVIICLCRACGSFASCFLLAWVWPYSRDGRTSRNVRV